MSEPEEVPVHQLVYSKQPDGKWMWELLDPQGNGTQACGGFKTRKAAEADSHRVAHLTEPVVGPEL